MNNDGSVLNDVEQIKRQMMPVAPRDTQTNDFKAGAKAFDYIYTFDHNASGYLAADHYKMNYDDGGWSTVDLDVAYSPKLSAKANLGSAITHISKSTAFMVTRDIFRGALNSETTVDRYLNLFEALLGTSVTIPMDIAYAGIQLLGATKDLADSAIHGLASLIYQPDIER